MYFLELKNLHFDSNFTEVFLKGSFDKSALVQVMVRRRAGNKPLPEPNWPSSPTHIWDIRGRWVSAHTENSQVCMYSKLCSPWYDIIDIVFSDWSAHFFQSQDVDIAWTTVAIKIPRVRGIHERTLLAEKEVYPINTPELPKITYYSRKYHIYIYIYI